MNYLVIDLEMCRVPKHYRNKNYNYAYEIIQVGAVLLDEEYEVIGRLNQYVHPEYGVLDYFISNLTGIQESQLKHAPRLEKVLEYMIDWLGDREYKVYAWSDSDFLQLKHEVKGKNINNSKVEAFMDTDKWVDYQAVFGKRFDFRRAVSLEEALVSCNVDAEGRFHDGLDDAVNTAKLIRTLELNEDFVINTYEYEKEEVTDSLKFSMSELFAGLNLSGLATA